MIEQLEIGTKVYYVEEDNQFFRRKKIYFKDKNGVEWFRYDMPLRIQRMTEYTIVGRVLKTIEGVVPSIENHLDEYYLEDGNVIDENDLCADTSSGYFLDKDEALAWIEARRAETERIEHS